jgi:hypothetical protein
LSLFVDDVFINVRELELKDVRIEFAGESHFLNGDDAFLGERTLRGDLLFGGSGEVAVVGSLDDETVPLLALLEDRVSVVGEENLLFLPLVEEVSQYSRPEVADHDLSVVGTAEEKVALHAPAQVIHS